MSLSRLLLRLIPTLQVIGWSIYPATRRMLILMHRSPLTQSTTPDKLARALSNENEGVQVQEELDDASSCLTNPLTSGPPAFMSAKNGRTCTSRHLLEDSITLTRS